MKTVILDAYTANPGDLNWHTIEKITDLEIHERTAPSELIARAKGAEALLTNKVIISDEAMAQLPQLKYTGVLANGTNVVVLICGNHVDPSGGTGFRFFDCFNCDFSQLVFAFRIKQVLDSYVSHKTLFQR